MKKPLCFLIILFFSSFFLVVTDVFANEQMTPEQMLLNQQAIKAFSDKNYPQAELLFKATLELGESNTLWINLGRTQAKQNKCLEAGESFSKINLSNSAPEIAERYNRFKRELSKQCSAIIRFSCTRPDMLLYIDDYNTGKTCTDQAIFYIAPGYHTLRGQLPDGRIEQLIVNLSSSQTPIPIAFSTPEERKDTESAIPAPQDNRPELADNLLSSPEPALPPAHSETETIAPSLPDPNHASTAYQTSGWILLGTGLLTTAISTGIWASDYTNFKSDLASHVFPNKESALFASTELKERQVYLGFATAIGSAMLLTGTALLIIHHIKSGAQNAETSKATGLTFSPSALFTEKYAGISLNAEF